uniref:Replication-associated protein n=1 Tax=Red panda feces-associated genomovirus TaxID=2863991 RepID=A0A8K1M5D6_9VIRU|nr:replication-associated protein [Red panda feces-associated genomovirus]
MPFRVNAKRFFLTYPQSTELDHQYLHDHLTNLKEGTQVYSCREAHEGGESFHHHAIVSFERKYNCRNERYFDIEFRGRTYHPNVKSVIDLQASNVYIEKDGQTKGDRIRDATAERRNLYAEFLDEATNARSFMELVEQRDARNFVLNYDRLESFAKKRWGMWDEPEEPDYPIDSFANVPTALTDWVTTELKGGKDRPKCLIIVGGAELGKTSWARSLGVHHYWVNRFTGNRVANASYAVLDDFDTLDEHKHDFKGIWGSQKKVGVKVANGVSGYRTWDWSIPSIWLFNRLPACLADWNSYERQRSVLVEIEKPLY